MALCMASARQETVNVISRCRFFYENGTFNLFSETRLPQWFNTVVFLPLEPLYQGTRTRLTCQSALLALYHILWYDVNMAKKKTSIRYSAEAKALLEQLSKQLGISQSAVLELAIRTLAKQEGITQQT